MSVLNIAMKNKDNSNPASLATIPLADNSSIDGLGLALAIGTSQKLNAAKTGNSFFVSVAFFSLFYDSIVFRK